MWPKALSQLIELAPHLARLLPMADRFLSSKSADNDASRSAMQQMAEGLRGDLGQVTAAHSGLYQQLNAQADTLALHSEKLDALSAELHLTRLAADSIEARLTRLEERSVRLFYLLAVLLLLSASSLILLAAVLRHLH